MPAWSVIKAVPYALFKSVSIVLRKLNLREFRKVNSYDCIDSIIKALGLSPLPLVSNVGQIKKALKFRTAKTNLIDQVVNKCFKNAVSDYSK